MFDIIIVLWFIIIGYTFKSYDNFNIYYVYIYMYIMKNAKK